MRPPSVLAWRRASSVADLRELTVDWLEGRVRQTPDHAGPPEAETAEIRDALVALNRGGLLTTGSQPARPITVRDGFLWSGQRAWVDAVGRTELVSPLVRRLHDAGLMAMFNPAATGESRQWDLRWPVTYFEGTACTRVYADPVMTPFAARRAWLSRAARADLAGCVSLCVVDPHWGRADRLWDVLTDAVSP